MAVDVDGGGTLGGGPRGSKQIAEEFDGSNSYENRCGR